MAAVRATDGDCYFSKEVLDRVPGLARQFVEVLVVVFRHDEDMASVVWPPAWRNERDRMSVCSHDVLLCVVECFAAGCGDAEWALEVDRAILCAGGGCRAHCADLALVVHQSVQAFDEALVRDDWNRIEATYRICTAAGAGTLDREILSDARKIRSHPAVCALTGARLRIHLLRWSLLRRRGVFARRS